MRVLIASPRKTGNARLRCLLAAAYGLEIVGARDAPDGADLAMAASWLDDFPNRGVVHASLRHSAELEALAAQHGVTLIAIVRHPFDLFVSIHEIAQHRSRKKGRRSESEDPWSTLAGRDLADPAVLAYLRDGFADEIAWLTEWQDSGVPVLRFELLEADPAGALAELAAALGHLDDDAIARAVAVCPAEGVVRSSPVRGRRMPAVSAGAWRERLSDDHLAVLRDRFGDDIRRLGYEIA